VTISNHIFTECASHELGKVFEGELDGIIGSAV
jgi:hypothetical protein